MSAETVSSEPLDDETVSFMPYVRLLLEHRRQIGATVVVVAIVALLASLLIYVLSPTEHVGSIQVRFLFSGAADNKYPNGTIFSPSELISTPTLQQVYRSDELARFGSFEAFRDAMTVLRSSEQLRLLAEEYGAKLSDPKLAVADRMRLEDEYERKREALTDPTFALSLRRTERITSMPADLIEKTLNDILRAWATQAATSHGALRYNTPVLSRSILPGNLLETSDYLVAADVLRVQAERALDNAEQVSRLPGAEAFRPAGGDQTSLAEVRANLEDVLRLEVDPLIGFVRSESLARDSKALEAYFDEQFFSAKLKRDEQTSIMNSLKDALQNVEMKAAERKGESITPGRAPGQDATVMPQLSEGFLDRLIQMVKPETSDAVFQQHLTEQLLEQSRILAAADREVAYYSDLVSVTKSMRGQIPSAQALSVITTRSRAAFDDIGRALDRLSLIYQGLSEQNLNPAAQLYVVTSPFTATTERSVSLTRLLILSLIAVFVAAILVCGVYLIRGGKDHPGRRLAL